MTQNKMADLYLTYISVSQNITYGQVRIKPKTTFRSHSHLIIEVTKVLTSGKNVVEVASLQKVKFSDFLFLFSTNFSTKLPKYLLELWC